MNILVDGRTFCRYAAGITSVLKNALGEWSRLRPDDTFYLLLPKPLDIKIDRDSFAKNVKVLEYKNRMISCLPNIIILQYLVPYLCRKLKIDVYFSPVPHLPFLIPKRTTTVIIAHDVVNIEYQKTMSLTNCIANKYFFGYAINNCDILWYNSQYTKSKIVQYFPQRKNDREVVGISIDDSVYNVEDPDCRILKSLREKYRFNNDYILFVGSLEPRKKLSFLINLAPRLYSEYGLQLIVVGANKWKSSEISSIVNNKDFLREAVVFCGYVPNEELAALYHGARCFVSTSMNEGFGLPQLEALKCGCPIVTANNSAMAEIANGKDGAITVDGYEQDAWIKAISKTAVEHPSVNQTQLTDYNWERIITTLLGNL